MILLSAHAQQQLLGDLAAIEAPLGTTLRCSFVALGPQTGLSTVAGLTLRARRRCHAGRVLAVDMRPGQSASAVLQHGSPVTDDESRGIPAAVRQWMRQRDGLTALAFDHASASDWTRVVAPVVRHFDTVGTDWGPLPAADATDAALTAQVACVTGTWERESAESAIAFARALDDQTDCAPIVVLSDVARTRSTWPRLVATRLPMPLIALSHDPALAGGGRPSSRTLRSITTLAAALSTDTARRATSMQVGRHA